MPTAAKTTKPRNAKAAKPRSPKAAEPKSARKPAAPKNLKGGAAKLAWIQSQVTQAVQKTGTNERFGFKFFQEHGVLAIIKPLLAEIDAGVFVDFVDIEHDGNMTYGTLLFTVYDAKLSKNDQDWGVTSRIPATGQDQQDKGIYKLMTQATKYAYQKVFGIPTDALEDVDASEDETPSAAKGRTTRAKKISPTRAAELRGRGAELVEQNKIDNKRVTAYLTTTFGKSKVTELTPVEADQFETFLNEAAA